MQPMMEISHNRASGKSLFPSCPSFVRNPNPAHVGSVVSSARCAPDYRNSAGPLGDRLVTSERFNNESVGGVDADHVEPFVTGGGKSVWRRRPDYDYVAGAGNDLFPIDDHCRLTGEDDASFGIGMLMQSRAFPRLKVAQKEGNAGTVWLAFELDCGDCAFPLIATMQDVENSSSSRHQIVGCTPLGATREPEAEPA